MRQQYSRHAQNKAILLPAALERPLNRSFLSRPIPIDGNAVSIRQENLASEV
jgi:hypothetical protein